jgi:phenylalanyl-tRNA synthetase alpha chain
MPETVINLSELFKSAKSVNDCKSIREKLLNEGELVNLKEQIKTAEKETKKQIGARINDLKSSIQIAFEARVKEIQIENEKDNFIDFDPTFYEYNYEQPSTNLHPITLITNEIVEIFESMGFNVVDGPLVETQDFCMTKLNIPAYHPARAMQDTFYLEQKDDADENFVLRTHTSAVQIRYGKDHKPPFKIVAPGQVYRNEKIDATHDLMFHQIECLVVQERVSVSHLKTLIQEFYQNFFKDNKVEVRLRANYFPYTVPSMEVDITNPNPKAKDKWLEVGGAGLVHPKVLENMGIDSTKWQGLAFGFGIDRMAQIKLGFHGIGQLFNGDLNFLMGRN